MELTLNGMCQILALNNTVTAPPPPSLTSPPLPTLNPATQALGRILSSPAVSQLAAAVRPSHSAASIAEKLPSLGLPLPRVCPCGWLGSGRSR